MRFLLDTNILIPLEDSKIVLEPNLANFVRLASSNGHVLLYHPASERDIERDVNEERKRTTLTRLQRYERLENPPLCPWNTDTTNENDAADNEILYALERGAVHGLVTEDRGIHRKAIARNMGDKIYYIQTAEDYLRRLSSVTPVSLPNIREVSLYQIDVNHAFFDSLREAYQPFNQWYDRAARAGRRAWIYGEDNEHPQALCIYDVQTNERITAEGRILTGRALKLCTFKVGESVRGQKIGELFLKAAFRYATDNGLTNIFITAKPGQQEFLVDLLHDFGFELAGVADNGDEVYVKSHPVTPPLQGALNAFEYSRIYFPHYQDDVAVKKFLVPIRPAYHNILFPDHGVWQGDLFGGAGPTVGNAIKLAYLCHAQQNTMTPGDLVLFYRSDDVKAVTSIGIVERFEISNDHEEIASIVRRRTVYNLDQIRLMAEKHTKVLLFRLIGHFPRNIPYTWMRNQRIVNGPIQSISAVDDENFRAIKQYGHAT